jgi:hypothetical protein
VEQTARGGTRGQHSWEARAGSAAVSGGDISTHRWRRSPSAVAKWTRIGYNTLGDENEYESLSQGTPRTAFECTRGALPDSSGYAPSRRHTVQRMKRGCIKYVEGGSGTSFSIRAGSERRAAKGASVWVSALEVEAEGRAGRAWRCRDGDPNNLGRSGGRCAESASSSRASQRVSGIRRAGASPHDTRGVAFVRRTARAQRSAAGVHMQSRQDWWRILCLTPLTLRSRNSYRRH